MQKPAIEYSDITKHLIYFQTCLPYLYNFAFSTGLSFALYSTVTIFSVTILKGNNQLYAYNSMSQNVVEWSDLTSLC